MKVLTTTLAAITVAASGAMTAHAAFVVGAHSSETGNANFSFGGDTTTASESTPSAAVGLTGTNSIFGGAGVNEPDTYVFSYTPGVDADNTVFAAGAVLGSTTGFPGEGNVATGLTGGTSGTYNVYFTAPESTNISGGGSNFTITQDGASIVLGPLDLNNEGTGADTDPGDPFVGGANNAWLKIGTVTLTAGNTYTVTQEVALTNSFVSQRAHAVMWELQIPEPSTFALAGLALVGLAFTARRRAS